MGAKTNYYDRIKAGIQEPVTKWKLRKGRLLTTYGRSQWNGPRSISRPMAIEKPACGMGMVAVQFHPAMGFSYYLCGIEKA